MSAYAPGVVSSMPLDTMSSAPIDNNGTIYCRRCRHAGCDVKIIGCGCSVHAVSAEFAARKIFCETTGTMPFH